MNCRWGVAVVSGIAATVGVFLLVGQSLRVDTRRWMLLCEVVNSGQAASLLVPDGHRYRLVIGLQGETFPDDLSLQLNLKDGKGLLITYLVNTNTLTKCDWIDEKGVESCYALEPGRLDQVMTPSRRIKLDVIRLAGSEPVTVWLYYLERSPVWARSKLRVNNPAAAGRN